MAFSFDWENRVDGQDYVLADDVNGLAAGIQGLGNYGDTRFTPMTRKINGKALLADVTLTASDVGARAEDWLPTLAQTGGRGKNLADNPFFTVNQANNSGTFSTIGGYAIDRWKLTSGTVTINADKTLTLNGTLVQPREIALGVTAVADVYTTSGTATISYDDTTKVITLTSSGGTIKAVSLELGAVSTFKKPDGTLNEAPPDPQQELEKCRRHLLRIGDGYFRAGLILTGAIYFSIPITADLRANPALLSGGFTVNSITNTAQAGFTFTYYASPNNLIVVATKASHGLTDAVLRPSSAILDANL